MLRSHTYVYLFTEYAYAYIAVPNHFTANFSQLMIKGYIMKTSSLLQDKAFSKSSAWSSELAISCVLPKALVMDWGNLECCLHHLVIINIAS